MIVMEYAPGGTLFEFLQDRHSVLMEEEVGRREGGREGGRELANSNA